MRSGNVRTIVGSFLLIGLIALTSCSEDTYTVCPSFAVGAVEGFVTSSGEGVAATVGARPEEGPQRGEVIATAESDETGWYRLELPNNFYRIRVNPRLNASVIVPNPSDTVRVESNVVRLDLHRGRAELRITMPAELNDAMYRLRVDGDSSRDFSDEFTVEDGSITAVLPYLEPGPYTMSLRGPGMPHNFYLPGTLDENEADTLIATTDSVVHYDADFSDRFAFVSGHVTGSWQEANDGPPYVSTFATEDLWMDRVRCEDDGTFELAIVAPAQIRLLIEHGAMDRWYGGDSFDEAAFFAVEPGDHVTSIEVVESGFELLLSGPGPFINHDAELFIRHEDGRVFDVSGRYQSRIEIHNLEPGRYAIGVRSNCFDQVWQEQWFDGAASQADAILVDLAPGEYRRLDMMLVAGGRIAGDLLEASGERPNLVYCRLHDNGGEALCADAARVYDGEFDFSGLADGSYLLSARISGQEDWWYPGTLEREQATVIEIVDQAEITNFLWSLPESRKGVLR